MCVRARIPHACLVLAKIRSGSHETEVTVVGCLWVLGVKLGSFTRSARALNCQASSSAPIVFKLLVTFIDEYLMGKGQTQWNVLCSTAVLPK